MNVLIGFEVTQAVMSAFRERGFNAYSCDLKPCEGKYPENHLHMDIYEALSLKQWHFIGLHPVCTKMALSGNRHYGFGKPKHQERLDAVEWTIKLWRKACEICNFIYMENPMGAMNGDKRLPKAQVIHPYYFGDNYQKQTCLWLKGLPKLLHSSQPNLFEEQTHVDRGEMVTFKSGKRMPKWYSEAFSEKSEVRQAIRSATFPGIAKAMAEQWGNKIKEYNGK
jgi:hypothetical protein